MPELLKTKKREIKQGIEYLKSRRSVLVAKNSKEPSDYLSFFDTTIFYPERRKLREECGELGHDFTSISTLDQFDHEVCLNCEITRRKQNHDVSKRARA